MSHVTCHIIFFLDIVVKLEGRGFVINGAYPVFFLYFKMFGVFSFFLLSLDLVAILWQHKQHRFFLEEGGGNKTCTKVLSRCQKFACVVGTIFSKKKMQQKHCLWPTTYVQSQ